MSLFNAMRYNSVKEKTDLMMSLIPGLCCECDFSRSLTFELRLSDRDSPRAAFVREVEKIRELVVVGREMPGYYARVLKENISETDIAAVIQHIRAANTKFFRIEFHIRDSPVTPELQKIQHIIRFLHMICDRLEDGQEWLVHHESDGPWTLYIMHEGNYFRTDKNPESQQVVELDTGSHNPASLPDSVHPTNGVHAHLDELKSLI